jgi:hypothetical protein
MPYTLAVVLIGAPGMYLPIILMNSICFWLTELKNISKMKDVVKICVC